MSITAWDAEPDAIRQTRHAELDEAYRDLAEERALMCAAYRREPDELPEYDSPEWREMWAVIAAYQRAFDDAVIAQARELVAAARAAADAA